VAPHLADLSQPLPFQLPCRGPRFGSLAKPSSREKMRKSATVPSRDYDRETGQVFREWSIAPAALSHTDDWDRILRFPVSTGAASRTQGRKSLVEMAVKAVAENFGYVENVAWLQDLPDAILWRIWHYFDLWRRHVVLSTPQLLSPSRMELMLTSTSVGQSTSTPGRCL
jgi:hypothetical protein